MPGDTYTPPRQESSTVFDDGNVLEFRKAREDLRPVAEVEAERAAQEAYSLQSTAERELSPVGYAALQLEELHKARLDRMAA
jgi:hypothetical protein